MDAEPLFTGGYQCGAVRYALFQRPVSSICHCRMCQKATGSPIAAFAKLPSARFAWIRGQAGVFRSSSAAERHFCSRCGTPLTFRFLDDPEIEVTTATLDAPAALPPTRAFGVDTIVSHQHPDHDTPPDWPVPQLHHAEPQLPVADIAAASAFFQDILGFSIVFAHAASHARVRRDAAVLNLRAAPPPDATAPVPDAARSACGDLPCATIPIDDADRLFAVRPPQGVAASPHDTICQRGTQEDTMSLREKFRDELKTALKAGDGTRVSTLRLIIARLKDSDIAARPKGVERIPEDEIIQMLRGMVKSRRESIDLYRKGNRPELADREAAEIAVIETFLPKQLDESAVEQAVTEAMNETGATTLKDMVRVMAALKQKHGSRLDLSVAGPIARARLAAGSPL